MGTKQLAMWAAQSHQCLLNCLLLLLGCAAFCSGLDNGLGLSPPMGYSSWNDCASQITEARIRNVTRHMIETGLAAKGYVHINVDEGWFKGRDSQGNMQEDRDKFPSGMKALGEWIHDQDVPGKGKIMKYGLYTSRGKVQCSTQRYHGPGSQGFEAQDAKWMAEAGMDYLKEDSCGGSQDHQTAFADYGRMRDALNATNRSVYFSLCGWNSWYAPVGDSLGNSWRIAGDGQNWGALSNCINTNVPLSKYDKETNTGSGTNVWGKLLPQGEVALAFVSNENSLTNVTCDVDCLSQAGLAGEYKVRDLWQHKDLGTVDVSSPFAKEVAGHGSALLFKLSPNCWNEQHCCNHIVGNPAACRSHGCKYSPYGCVPQ